MKKLLKHVLSEVLGNDDFSIDEEKEENQINYIVKTNKDQVGLVIGKEGKTIKAIRSILRVRATLDKTSVNVSVTEE